MLTQIALPCLKCPEGTLDLVVVHEHPSEYREAGLEAPHRLGVSVESYQQSCYCGLTESEVALLAFAAVNYRFNRMRPAPRTL